ncbi:MAG: hypothetical protein Q8O09_00185, partial [Bacillota bacterium]|nr:hypothetical protein [Bacillota bacterium]
SKDVQKGMEMLQTLLRQGENPQAVTGAAASRLREMLRAKLYLESGLSRQQAVAALGGNPYAAGRAVAECSRYSTKRLSSALMKLAETDFAVKTGRAQQRTGLECALIEAFGFGNGVKVKQQQ